MIPHPGVELALTRANGNRCRAREIIRDAIMASARQEADLAGRSKKCRTDQHAQDDYGCRNDGTNCICSCHDPQT